MLAQEPLAHVETEHGVADPGGVAGLGRKFFRHVASLTQRTQAAQWIIRFRRRGFFLERAIGRYAASCAHSTPWFNRPQQQEYYSYFLLTNFLPSEIIWTMRSVGSFYRIAGAGFACLAGWHPMGADADGKSSGVCGRSHRDKPFLSLGRGRGSPPAPEVATTPRTPLDYSSLTALNWDPIGHPDFYQQKMIDSVLYDCALVCTFTSALGFGTRRRKRNGIDIHRRFGRRTTSFPT